MLNRIKYAKIVIQDDAYDALTQWEEKIMAVKPPCLYDLLTKIGYDLFGYNKLDETEFWNYEVVDTGDPLTDTAGNQYAVGNLFTISAEKAGTWGSSNGYAKFSLANQYNRLVGTVSVSNESYDANAVLKIIGDGATLYSVNINRTTAPQSFDLDVSSVKFLKISIAFDGVDWWAHGAFTAILSDCHFVGA